MISLLTPSSCFMQAYLWDNNEEVVGWLERQLAEEEGARSVIDENIKYIRRDHILKQIRRWEFSPRRVQCGNLANYLQPPTWQTRKIHLTVIFSWFPFHFQPCSSQSRGCHGFYCAHDPAHLTHTESWGGAYPVHNGDVGLLLMGAWLLLCGLAWSTAQAAATARGAWLSHTGSWLRSGLQTEARGANTRALGRCLVTVESLAMILSKSSDEWHQLHNSF